MPPTLTGGLCPHGDICLPYLASSLFVLPGGACLCLQGVRTGRSVLHHSVSAADGTRKFLLQLADGLVVETVRGRVGAPGCGPGCGRAGLQACGRAGVRALVGDAPLSIPLPAPLPDTSVHSSFLCLLQVGIPADGTDRKRLTVCVSSQVTPHLPADGWLVVFWLSSPLPAVLLAVCAD